MNEKLELMIVPIQADISCLLPKSLVEFVLPYAPPLPSSYDNKALVGSIIYHNDKVPVIDIGSLYKASDSGKNALLGQRRLIMISSISKHTGFSNYALVADSAPRLLEVEKSGIRETNITLSEPFYSQVTLDELPGHNFLILDLELLESTVFE